MVQPSGEPDLTFCVCKYKDESEVEPDPIKVGGFRGGGTTKNGGDCKYKDESEVESDPIKSRRVSKGV